MARRCRTSTRRRTRAFFVTIRTLAEAGTILAYHDRSDGGLFATLTEMAFAGRTGISVNLDMLTFDPQSADWGDYKIRPEQSGRAARRADAQGAVL